MLSLLRLNSSSEIWQVEEITVAADWWSVGALLYELITGQVRVTYLLNYCLLKYLKLLESSKSAMDKSPWDSNAIFVFFCHSGFPHKTVHPSRNVLAVLPPPTLYKVETRKKFWIHASNTVCGVRGGVGPV